MNTLKFLATTIAGLTVTGFASFAVLAANGIGVPLIVIVICGSVVTSLAMTRFTPL